MRVASVQSLSPSDFSAWSALAERAVDPNPFFEPGFVLATTRSLSGTAPLLLIEERRDRWIGCLPVQPGRRPIRTTWQHPYVYVGTPLIDSDCLEEYVEALIRALESDPLNRPLFLRNAIDSDFLVALREAVRRSRKLATLFERTAERAALMRRDGAEDPLAHLKPRRRREFEKRRQKMAEACGSTLAVVDRSASPDAVEDLLRLEASSWKGEAGTAMATAGDADVLRSICETFSRSNRLQLLSLECGGSVLAMQCNISRGATLFNFKVAFDEAYRRFAPGIQLELDAIGIFQSERDERLFDSCADPENELLNRLWPDRLGITTLVVGRSGITGRIAKRVLDSAYRRRMARRAA
jgi:CelD/BcsL family acetyltransferase involved in cellulose biosynthesis